MTNVPNPRFPPQGAKPLGADAPKDKEESSEEQEEKKLESVVERIVVRELSKLETELRRGNDIRLTELAVARRKSLVGGDSVNPKSESISHSSDATQSPFEEPAFNPLEPLTGFLHHPVFGKFRKKWSGHFEKEILVDWLGVRSPVNLECANAAQSPANKMFQSPSASECRISRYVFTRCPKRTAM